jgi:hypothetical protein
MAVTHNTMYNGVLSEQDNLSWCTDKPFAVLLFPRWTFVVSQFLHCTANSGSSARNRCAHKLMLISAGRNSDSAGLKKGMLKVIDKVHRVFDTNTQANKVLGQPTFRTHGSVNRCVPICTDSET